MPALLGERAIARLVMYRRLLERLREEGAEYVFSHTLADLGGLTAAQVRRDVMELEYLGNPARGYRVVDLLARIRGALDPPARQSAVLAGAGQLGGALVSYFDNWSQRLNIVGVFDVQTLKLNRKVHGHVCQHLRELPETVERYSVSVGVLAVPAAAAVEVAGMMVQAGITGILNFAPVTLVVPEHVYVEQVDLTVSIERVAYMARHAAELPSRRGHEHRSN